MDITSGKLLSANGGTMFNDWCLRPEFNTMQCDIRLADDTSPFLEGTRGIILLGEYAMHKYVESARGNILNELRGSPFYVQGIPAICSFFPQDAVDFKNYEKEHNTEQKTWTSEEEVSEEDEGDVKRFAHTKRSNFAFWLQQDCKKLKRLLHSEKTTWPIEPEPTYRIYPPADEVINALLSTENGVMDFDMETDYEERNMQCFSFSFDSRIVYSVPVLDFNYQWAYSSLHYIIRALVIAMSRNTVVAHNGAGFDFPVLGYKYRIPISRPYDTMIAQHRIYPDVEKSLGHCTSLWTYQRFHKDENPGCYFTQEQMMNTLRYCGKDVFTMSLIRKAQYEFAKTIPGLLDSIECANNSIRPYLTTSLQGIPYNEAKRQAKLKENDALMTQYLRCINLLVGEHNIETIRKSSTKGKSKGVLPSSNPQATYYFHEMLGYRVVGRGKPSKKDGTRKPSLAKKNLYKLRLLYNNPVIDFCNLYRSTKLESSTPLGFIPFKDDNNKVINPNTYGKLHSTSTSSTDSTQETEDEDGNSLIQFTS